MQSKKIANFRDGSKTVPGINTPKTSIDFLAKQVARYLVSRETKQKSRVTIHGKYIVLFLKNFFLNENSQKNNPGNFS